MIKSASETDAPRESASEIRRERTRRELTAQARRLTAQLGLGGFTVEELCEHVGVSRRTFFNYFPGKEQAVIGVHDDDLDAAAVEAFLSGRPDGTRGVSPTLMDDLLAFAVAQMDVVGLTPHEASAFIAAVQREPRLFESLMNRGEEHDRYLTMLVGTREGLIADHPVPRAAVTIMGALGRTSTISFLSPGNSETYREILSTHLEASRAIFAAATRP